MKDEQYIQGLLSEAGVAADEPFHFDQAAMLAEYAEREHNQTSLPVKVLSIAGGILATAALFGFLVIADLFGSQESMFYTGIFFAGAGLLLDRFVKNLLLDTSCVALYVGGLGMMLAGMTDFIDNENIIYLLYLGIGLATFVLAGGDMMAFLGLMIAAASVSFFVMGRRNEVLLMLTASVSAAIFAMVMYSEAHIVKGWKVFSKRYDAIRTASLGWFLVCLGLLSMSWLFDRESRFGWIPSVVIIGLLIFFIDGLLKKLGVEKPQEKYLIFAASVVLLLLTIFSPTISGSLLILLLSFRTNYRVGFVVGVLAFLYFVSRYYYDLSFTLLEKSGLMFFTGVLFLLFYFFTRKKLAQHD